MQIIIDTEKDSQEEIRKAIRMLRAYVGDSTESTESSYTPSPVPDASPGMFNIFGNDDSNGSEASKNDDYYGKDSDDEPRTIVLDEEKKPGEKPPRVEIVEY